MEKDETLTVLYNKKGIKLSKRNFWRKFYLLSLPNLSNSFTQFDILGWKKYISLSTNEVPNFVTGKREGMYSLFNYVGSSGWTMWLMSVSHEQVFSLKT